MRAHDGCAANIKLSVVGWVGGIVQIPVAYDFSGICAHVCDNSSGSLFPPSLPEEECIVGIL